MDLRPYLTFNGNCRDAMEFYQQCLGGELLMQSFEDSPIGKCLPAGIRKYILQATLKLSEITLMGTDAVADNGLHKGNSVTLYLVLKNKEEIQRLFRKLSKDARESGQLSKNFFGQVQANFIDKFGVHWMLSLSSILKS